MLNKHRLLVLAVIGGYYIVNIPISYEIMVIICQRVLLQSESVHQGVLHRKVNRARAVFGTLGFGSNPGSADCSVVCR